MDGYRITPPENVRCVSYWLSNMRRQARTVQLIDMSYRYCNASCSHPLSIAPFPRYSAAKYKRTTHPSLSPDQWIPSQFIDKLTVLKVEAFCAIFQWKSRDHSFSRFATIHSRHRLTDDRRHIMTTAELCDAIATFCQQQTRRAILILARLRCCFRPKCQKNRHVYN